MKNIVLKLAIFIINYFTKELTFVMSNKMTIQKT